MVFFATYGSQSGPPPAPYVEPVPSAGGLLLSSSRGSVALSGVHEVLEGTAGLGPAARKAVVSGALGIDGVIVNPRRPYRRDKRLVSFIVHIEGQTPRERAEAQRKLLAVISPYDGTLVRVGARIENDDIVEAFGIAELGGGEEFSAQAFYDSVAVVSFDILFPDPVWRAGTRSKGQQQAATAAAFFPLLPLTLTRTAGLGTAMTLDVGGDTLAYPRHVLTGPATKIRCTSSAGPFWELDLLRAGLPAASIIAGQTIVVDTNPRVVFSGKYRVTGPAGQDYSPYLTSRQLFALEPKIQQLTYLFTGIGAGSSVTTSWEPGIEAVL